MLQELTEDGHCAFPHADLAKKAQTMLGIAPEIIEAALTHGLSEGRLVEGPDATGNPLIYLRAYEYAERKLAENLIELAKGQHPCPPVDVPKAVAWWKAGLASHWRRLSVRRWAWPSSPR